MTMMTRKKKNISVIKIYISIRKVNVMFRGFRSINVDQRKHPNDVFDRMIVVFLKAYQREDLMMEDNDVVRVVLKQIFHHQFHRMVHIDDQALISMDTH